MSESRVPLEERFTAFLGQMDNAESIDGTLPEEDLAHGKRADFLLNERRVVLEIKSLEVDPSSRRADLPLRAKAWREHPNAEEGAQTPQGAVEAVIGHMKTDGRMDRCRLKGARGDALNAVLVAAGHNIRLLLRAMADLLRQLLDRLLVVIGAGIRDRDFDPSIRTAA